MSERLKNCSSVRGDDSPRWSVCVKGAVQHLENWCREGFTLSGVYELRVESLSGFVKVNVSYCH